MWGYLAKVGVPKFKRINFRAKTFDCVFIGYAHNSVAYKFMCLCESRNTEFFECVLLLKKNVCDSPSNDACIHVFMHTSSSINDAIVKPMRSKRRRTKSSFELILLFSFLMKAFLIW